MLQTITLALLFIMLAVAVAVETPKRLAVLRLGVTAAVVMEVHQVYLHKLAVLIRAAVLGAKVVTQVLALRVALA